MSATTTPPDPPAPPPTTAPVPLPSDRMLTPQTIIAFMCMLIGGGTLGAILWQGDPQLRSQALVAAVGLMSIAANYYFQSSKGSADKDARSPVLVSPNAPLPAATADLTAALNRNTAVTANNTNAAKPPGVS